MFFAAITAFWLVMNVMLWRSQSSAHNPLGGAVPVKLVWDKILTAPDNSSLDIYDHDKKTGFCQWTVNGGSATEALNRTLADDYAPDGLTPEPSGYGLTVDGNVGIFVTNRVRYEMQLRLSTNETWQDFRLDARLRDDSWELHAMAASQKVVIKVNTADGSWQNTLKFSDFDHPETLLAALGYPDVVGPMGLPLPSVSQAAANVRWQAHEDWMQFGHSRVQVYRLETSILGQPLRLFISRAGEILWVDGPVQITLRSEAFGHF
jgi:hypothetical protein